MVVIYILPRFSIKGDKALRLVYYNHIVFRTVIINSIKPIRIKCRLLPRYGVLRDN